MVRNFFLLLALAIPSLGLATQSTAGTEAPTTMNGCGGDSSVAKSIMGQTALAKWAVMHCDTNGSAIVPIDGTEWRAADGSPHVFQAGSPASPKEAVHFGIPRFLKIPDDRLGPANMMLSLQGGRNQPEFKEVYKLDLPTTRGGVVMLMFFAHKGALGYVLGCRDSWQDCLLLKPQPAGAREASGRTPDEPSLMQITKDWAAVSGGWHLNNRCRLLAADDASKYNTYVEAIREELKRNQQTQSLIALVERAGQEEAGSARYADCERAREIVQQASKLAEQWATRIQNPVQ